MKLNKKITKYLLALIAIIALAFVIPFRVSAKGLTQNGTYEAPISLDLKMGADAFSDKVIIEKDNHNYYLTFTQVDSSNLANMQINLGGATGEIVREEGKKKAYTYTVGYEDLTKPIRFSVIVTVMNKHVEFNMDIDLANALYIGKDIEDLGERPARYLPVINTNATEGEFEYMSTYLIPEAKAALKDEEIEASYKVYYIKDGERKEVEATGGKLKFEEIGEYHLVYEAQSDLYKTSLGNNTKSTLDIKLISKVGATSLGKIEASDTALPKDYMLQTTILKNGELFDMVSNKMITIADSYQIFNVALYNEAGDKINPAEEVLLYLMADESFNRKHIKCYYLDEGTYTEIALENYGRYVRLSTDKVGTFVIYVPGVEFHMPIWGYAIIGVGSLLALIGLITVPIVIHSKRKKRNQVN